MKVFFTASHRGKKNFGKQHQTIYKSLENLGFKHLSDSLISVNTEEYYDGLVKDGSDGFVQENTRMLKNIKEADITVFETSFPSLGIGYMIQKSLEANKPVVALYLKGHKPTFLTGIQDEKFQLIEYHEDDLQTLLTEAMEKAQTLADKRFNFFISPSLLTYLNQASKEAGVTKSTFIRNLINDYRRKLKQ